MIGPRFDNWRRIFRGGVGLIALLILEKLAAQEPDLASTWETGPPPAWADVAPISPHAPTQAQQPGETTRYLLVDEQVHTAKSEYYTRRVYEVLNESGVQQNSTLSATYQPDYQSLILHTAAVWRGDALEEQLDAKRIRVVQEELDSASHVYRGEARAFLVLNDVRVGDRIEFAYTVRGRNPVLDGHYVGGFLTGWMVPVERIRFRVLWPGSRPIHWRAVRNDVSPDSRSNPDGTEMFWSLSNTAAEIVEPNTPSWYPPLPWVQLSDFDAWSDVAKWASQLFPQNLDLPPALETHLKDWSALSNDDEKAEAALQFVQNEIRYVGIEIGINSHRPSEPATVLTRRFGDCKDKTQLLIAILQRLGITAQPLLVNQAARGTITNWWPSPYAFNHAVVLAHGRTNQWLLDPTLSFQRGPLSARYVPDFGAGLIASPTSTQLIRLDSLARGTPYTRVDEDFRVAEKGQPSELIVTTRSSGLAAEIVRAQFASTPRSDLERGYRNYYARQYPTIEALNPIDFTDITNINLVVTTERYRIPDLWERAGTGDSFKAQFFPPLLTASLSLPEPLKRHSPLTITYPRRIRVVTRLALPREWKMTPEKTVIRGPATRLEIERTRQSREMRFDFDYNALADHVDPSQMEEHVAALRKIDSSLGYELTLNSSHPQRSATPINWLAVFLVSGLSVGLAGLVGLIAWYFTRPRLPPPLPSELKTKPDLPPGPTGIGGWLILIAARVCLSPLLLLQQSVQIYSELAFPALRELKRLGSNANYALWNAALIFELLTNAILLGTGVWMLVLFWKRHRWFPRVFVATLVARMVFLIFDETLGRIVHGFAPKDVLFAGLRVAVGLIFSVILCLYIMMSVRVKRTFVQ